MLRALYTKTMALAQSPRAEAALAAVSFAESSFFPIPPDMMLAPMCLARPQRAFRYAAICTIASVVGGLLGYAIGFYLFTVIGEAILRFYGHPEGMATFTAAFQKYGLWIILIKGATPIPYKLVTIAAGAAHFSLPVFVAASIATRGARFFLVTGVLKLMGDRGRIWLEKNLTVVMIAMVALMVIGVVAVKVLVPHG
jgi:membrane protein YqaA with SNARE-associated domain